MSFRPTLFVPALLALAIGLAHPQAVQAADGAVINQIVTKVQIHVSPPYVQPGGLVHVSIQPDSPQMISSFFDVFTELDAGFRPSFFDVFVADDLRFRPAFFDVFCEISRGPGGSPVDTEMLPLSLVCGFLSKNSIELLMQLPMTDGHGGGGGGGVIGLRCQGMTLGTAPVTLADESSAMRLVLDSGHAIDSFFDIFTELSFGGGGGTGQPGSRIGSFFDVFTELRMGRLILRKAGEAEMAALRARVRESPTRRSLAADVLRCLLHDLEVQLMTDLRMRH